jgi:hypothetical protein
MRHKAGRDIGVRNGAVSFDAVDLHLNVVPHGVAGDRSLHVDTHLVVVVQRAGTAPKIGVLELSDDILCRGALPLIWLIVVGDCLASGYLHGHLDDLLEMAEAMSLLLDFPVRVCARAAHKLGITEPELQTEICSKVA